MKASPRRPMVTPSESLADRLELINVPRSGASIESPNFEELKIRAERDAGGSPEHPNPPKLGGKFRSKVQWRWAFARKMPFAHRWAHKTGPPKIGYHSLPERKGPPTPGSLR